nr:conjugal transfer protein TraX [Escherichia coli]
MPLTRLTLNNGSLELLKWIAVALMTGDHINKYLFNGTLPYLFEAGRIVMPIFVFILAYNLARPHAYENGVYQRMILRLVTFAILATPIFISLGSVINGWFPLNILFTLSLIVVIVAILESSMRVELRAICAVAVFCGGGSLVEFWWPAVALGVVTWWFFKKPNYLALLLGLGSLLLLSLINGNHWALAAVPVSLAILRMKFSIPQMKWFFYTYYPLHLLTIFLVRIPMRDAGYLFFN